MNKNIIDKHNYYSNLFDYYEVLFTEKQIEYFKDYYFYDLSLSEIAENHQISRSAVHDVIKKVHESLDDYEKKLGLYEKNKQLIELCEEYEEIATKEKNILAIELIKKLKENE
ncbi:MAG: DNA-binding protein [Bacilli bacterium]|nr:DNA-binding protein [Bacilli bacterium]